MKDKTRPVEVDGKKFFVDRTFSGAPAAYRIIQAGIAQNISGGRPLRIVDILNGLEAGKVLIIADRVD